MADKNFVVKNTLVANTIFTANSINLSANGLTVNSTGGFFTGFTNATAFYTGNTFGTSAGVGSTTNSTFLGIGNATINAYLTTTGLVVNNSTIANTSGVYTGTVNAAVLQVGTSTIINSSGVWACNSPASLNSSQVNTVFVFATTVNAGTHSAGSNNISNTSGFFTNGTVNSVTVSTTTVLATTVNAASHTTGGGYGSITGGAVVNTAAIGVGNSTVNAIINTSALSIGGNPIANSTGANNAFNLGGSPSSSYINTTGTYTISGVHTHTSNIEIRSSNLIINTTAGIIANGFIGTPGQALLSNGSTVYWASVNSSVITSAGSNTQIQFNLNSTLAASPGLTFNNVTNAFSVGNTVTVGTGVTISTINATSFSGQSNTSLTANNALYLGGTVAASFALKADTTYIGTTSIALNRSSLAQTLTGVSIDGTANNVTYVGTNPAAAVVNTAQLSGNLSFYTTTTTLAASGLVYKASTLAQGGGTGAAMTFNWSGQGGQPSWLWGGNDGANHYVYNPSNFNVNSASYATNAGTAGNATNLGGTAASSYITNGSSSKTLYSFYTNIIYDTDNNGYYLDLNGNSRFSSIYTDYIRSYGNQRIDTSLGVGTDPSGSGGDIRATGNITAYYSDARLKNFKGKITDALNKVSALSGYHYEANELAQSLGYKPVPEVGVSAQEVEAVMPEVVAPAPIDDKYLTVRYERLIPLLIEAIKELKAEVDTLKNRD